MRAAMATVLFVVLVGVWWRPPQSTVAQDDPDATIEALQTEVATLRTQVASLTTPAASTATPQSGTAPIYVGGSGVALLPSGDRSGVPVIAVGPYDRGLPVILRNNTAERITEVSVSSDAKAADGQLLASGGSSIINVWPSTVLPGALAFANISFDQAELPSDVSFEFEVEWEQEGGGFNLGWIDLEYVEATVREDRVVGTLQNRHDNAVTDGAHVGVMCLGDDGVPLSIHDTVTSENRIDPDETVSFQVELFGSPCPYFLVAAYGLGE